MINGVDTHAGEYSNFPVKHKTTRYENNICGYHKLHYNKLQEIFRHVSVMKLTRNLK